MRTLRYLHLDVFTSTPFEGNQLAVFPDPGELSAETMQRIAREMAFSESTFIYPAEKGGDVRMRIFTPGEELPMAGHPTIGSTFALAIEGTIPRGREGFVFELGVGPTPVSLEWEKTGLSFAWMTQPLPVFGTIIEDRAGMAAALGIEMDSVAGGAAYPGRLVRRAVPVRPDRHASRGRCRRDRPARAGAGVQGRRDRRAAGVSVYDRGGSRRGDGLQPHAGARFRDRGGSRDRRRQWTARLVPAAPRRWSRRRKQDRS